MSTERYHICDECGMQYSYTCERETYCPGCGSCLDNGNCCTCRECLTFENRVKTVATAVDISTEQAAAVLLLITPNF